MEWMSMRGVCAPVMGSAAGKEVAAGSTACCREGGTGQRGGECPVMGRDTCLRYTGVVLHPACRKPCDCKRLLVLTYSVKTQEFEIRNQGPKMVAKATGRRGICHIGEKERSGF